jgi:hypothetical protein
MSEVSDAQLAANRANSQLSRGPVTELGKCRSSMNAIRHGLSSRTVVLPNEDVGRYQSFCQELLASLDPQTPLERELAQTVIDQQWRLNRIRTVEDGMFALQQPDSCPNPDTGSPEADAALAAASSFRQHANAFVNLTVYEQRIHRVQREALKQLKELQAERRAKEQAQLEEAIKLQKLHQMQGRSYDPQANGFVYSSAQIDREAARRALLQTANLAENVNYNLSAFRAILDPAWQKESKKPAA